MAVFFLTEQVLFRLFFWYREQTDNRIIILILVLNLFKPNQSYTAMMAQRPDRRGWDKVAYEKHLERLNNSKSTIDNSPPKINPMLKRVGIEKVRFLKIMPVNYSASAS